MGWNVYIQAQDEALVFCSRNAGDIVVQVAVGV